MNKFFSLLFAGLTILMAACASNDKANNQAAESQAEPFESSINIRYVWSDSIAQYYTFAQATALANQQIQTELLAYGNQLQNQVQAMQQQFNQKLQNNGFLTEAGAQSEAKKLQQTAANYDKLYSQREQQAMQQIADNNKALHDSIMNFIHAYNRVNKYDAILYGESALFLNPSLDITQEVIDGLNARYKAPVAAPAVKADAADAKK